MEYSDLQNSKILITGGGGFLGSHVHKKLLDLDVPAKNIYVVRSAEFDLREKDHCQRVMQEIDIVLHLAATVGGIGYNKQNPATVFYDNLMLGTNLLHTAYLSGVKKFVSIGTVCSYPKFLKAPFKEEDIWKGYPEETNASYGLSKKMQIVQSQAYRDQYGFNSICLIPTNLYGPGDNFDPKSSHVIPALIKKIHDAKVSGDEKVTVWGTGAATREFIYVNDAAEAIVRATEKYNSSDPVNIASGVEISIRDLVILICEIMDYNGEIVWDKTKPDGQPRRSLDTTKAKEKFKFIAETSLQDGIRKTIAYYIDTLT